MDDDALAAHIHAATHCLLALIVELVRREVWAAQGALSCAHWLSWACGIAWEKVRVARALTGLSLLTEALATGEPGYSTKDRALTRIATPETDIPTWDVHPNRDRALARRVHHLRPCVTNAHARALVCRIARLRTVGPTRVDAHRISAAID